MKPFYLFVCSSMVCSSAAWAQAAAPEMAQVLSRTPVYEQVQVPQQVCTPVASSSTSGAGALMGAIAGGAIGHQIGGGSGQALATMVGVIGGGMLGDRIETPVAGSTLHCSVQHTTQNRIVGYQVVYTYAGKQYQAQLPYDPGSTLALQITPVGASPTSAATAPAVVYTAPATVIMAPARPISTYRPPVVVQHWPFQADLYIHREFRTDKHRHHRPGPPWHARPHGHPVH